MTSQPFLNFRGDALYLDTNIFYGFLRASTPLAKRLFQAIEQGEYQGYTSILTFDELAYRLLLKSIGENYSGSPLDKFRKEGPEMIAEFLPSVSPLLLPFRHYTNFTIIETSAEDLDQMLANMEQYHLKPRDALHLAAMQKCNCMNIVTNDSDFDLIPDIQRYTLT